MTQAKASDPKSNDAPLPTESEGPEPGFELVAHFKDPAVRKRLLGKALWVGTPDRRAEDVVQTTLTDAWRRRHAWPDTTDGLDKWLFTALHNDMIDAGKVDRRAPLMRKPKEAKDPAETKGIDDPRADADTDDAEPAAVTTTVVEPMLEARDRLRAANEYVESRPALRKPFVWLLQTKMGMTYADIAAKEHTNEKVVRNALNRLREELRKVFGAFIILAAFALVYVMVRGLHGYVNDQAHPDVPKPTPNIVAPPAPPPAPAPTTAPELSASEPPRPRPRRVRSRRVGRLLRGPRLRQPARSRRRHRAREGRPRQGGPLPERQAAVAGRRSAPPPLEDPGSTRSHCGILVPCSNASARSSRTPPTRSSCRATASSSTQTPPRRAFSLTTTCPSSWASP